MPIKDNIRYEINPREIEEGRKWVTVTLENNFLDRIMAVSIELYSTDSMAINVIGSGEFVPLLEHNEETIIPFQLVASKTTELYITVEGTKDGTPFYWVSPFMTIQVGAPVAEIASLFVLTEPYPILTKELEAEATIIANTRVVDLRARFWVDTPRGEYLQVSEDRIFSMEKDEVETVSATYLTDEEGLHRFYVYLYDGTELLDKETDTVVVIEEE